MIKDNRDIFAVSLMAIGALMVLAGAVGFFEEIIFHLPWYLALMAGGFIAIIIAGMIG